jgi:hypothetical protein
LFIQRKLPLTITTIIIIIIIIITKECQLTAFLGSSLITTQKEEGREADHWKGGGANSNPGIGRYQKAESL